MRSFFSCDALILKILVATQIITGLSTERIIEWKERAIAATFVAASWLTEPLCQTHQLYRQTQIVDVLYSQDHPITRRARKGILWLSATTHGVLALATTLPGIELRFLANKLQKAPFLHCKGSVQEKIFDENHFSLLSWNLCCLTGGYSITEGGVLPWQFRKERIVEALLQQNADVICLYEIFDIQLAHSLVQGLKNNYNDFYYHVGPSVVGLSSGLFVASKSKIGAPEFEPFPEEALWGRSRLIKKGVFKFDVLNESRTVATIFATHFQHSEMPDTPIEGELFARHQEMALIMKKMENVKNLCVLTGDLNLAENEYNASSWKEMFDHGDIRGEGSTWGGDAFCASLMGKAASAPANLDHTMIKKGEKCAIKTVFVETGFDGTTFKQEALSDHKGLMSVISFALN